MSQSEQPKNKTTVEIYNRSYTVIGEEDSRHVRMVASLVDQTMRDINEANPSLDTAKLAVLTAVNTMNDYLKLKEEYEDLMKDIEKLEKEDKNNHD